LHPTQGRRAERDLGLSLVNRRGVVRGWTRRAVAVHAGGRIRASFDRGARAGRVRRCRGSRGGLGVGDERGIVESLLELRGVSMIYGSGPRVHAALARCRPRFDSCMNCRLIGPSAAFRRELPSGHRGGLRSDVGRVRVRRRPGDRMSRSDRARLRLGSSDTFSRTTTCCRADRGGTSRCFGARRHSREAARVAPCRRSTSFLVERWPTGSPTNCPVVCDTAGDRPLAVSASVDCCFGRRAGPCARLAASGEAVMRLGCQTRPANGVWHRVVTHDPQLASWASWWFLRDGLVADHTPCRAGPESLLAPEPQR